MADEPTAIRRPLSRTWHRVLPGVTELGWTFARVACARVPVFGPEKPAFTVARSDRCRTCWPTPKEQNP